MSLSTLIVSSVSVFCCLQLVFPAAAIISNRQDGFCPELYLDSGESLDVGCFDYYLGTFGPDMPDSINATYALYRNGNASVPYRNWSYNETFRNESKRLFNSKSYLSFIIHGFRTDAEADWVFNMTRALLLQSEPRQRNVITVDWKSGAEGPNYIQAALNVFMVGRLTAELIHRLVLRYNLNPDRIHIIGHSLGGQTLGQITEWLFDRFGTKVGRATGLDVAATGFEGLNLWPNKSHSKFLEVIHTSSGNNLVGGSVGLKDNFGHVDLYPNGGVVPQPGCPTPPLQISCSHSKAKSFYTDFLLNCLHHCQYTGYTCSSVTDAVNANCTGSQLDICQFIELLRKRANDDEEEIVYIDTTMQDVPDRCTSNFVTKKPGIVTRVVGSILSYLYWTLGITRFD